MSKDDLDEFVIHFSGEPSIRWLPEDYGFVKPEHIHDGVWYYKSYELRARPNDYWLLRRKVKNKRGNSEMLVKWLIKIPLEDKDFADVIFTKGLR
jgi:hypothetical protein